MKLSSYERIMRLFQNKEVDRPALKLWGAGLENRLLHPDYQPVCELAARQSDLFEGYSTPFNVYCGQNAQQLIEYEIKDTDQPFWQDRHVTFHTPEGKLHGIERISTRGEPSYTLEYLVKEPEDIDKLLSMPYEPDAFNPDAYWRRQAHLGDRGVVLFTLHEAGYALHRMTGSENLAYFSVDCRDKLDEILSVYSSRVREFTGRVLSSGLTVPFQWAGPEVFIPPLASPKDFADFVFRYDKLLCDDIHQAGGYVWVHCHGKVANFIGRFIDMGVDILNPLEPPKNGDIELATIIGKFGSRIGWEGNIEIQDIIQAEPERLQELIRTCVQAGNQSGRFILCPSAGFMEYPFPAREYINNLLLYLQYGWECVEQCRDVRGQP